MATAGIWWEVEQLYQAWLQQAYESFNLAGLLLGERPTQIIDKKDWYALSQLQNQAWWLDYDKPNIELWAWMFEQQVVGVLIQRGQGAKWLRLRQGNNQLACAELMAQVELWLASKEGFKN